MNLTHSDKSVTARESKLSPAAQAAYDHNTRNLSLRPDEANEVGRAVALAAENRAYNDPHRVAMREAVAPTKAEAEELTAAIAVWQTAHDATVEAHRRATDARQDYADEFRAGYDGRYPDPGREVDMIRLNSKAEELERALERASQDEENTKARIGRARGLINANGAARLRRYVSGRI